MLLKVIYKRLVLGSWLPITLPQGLQHYHAAKALSIQDLQRLSLRLVLTIRTSEPPVLSGPMHHPLTALCLNTLEEGAKYQNYRPSSYNDNVYTKAHMGAWQACCVLSEMALLASWLMVILRDTPH